MLHTVENIYVDDLFIYFCISGVKTKLEFFCLFIYKAFFIETIELKFKFD